MNEKIFLLILILTIIGGLLRFINIKDAPLNVDEVSTGYNAYSILKTGHDEYGFKLPLTFKSLGDYKPPAYIYLSTIPIAFFGLSEFSVRFLSAFFGTLSIPVFYFLFLKLVNNYKYALLASLILTVSPWHIYFSRFASESQVATFFVALGIIFLFNLLKGSWYWSIPAAVFLSLSMYTYHSERLFIPLFITLFLIINRKEILIKKKGIYLFILTGIILSLPLAFSLIFGPDRIRAQMTVITNDIDFIRYINLDPKNPLLLFFYWARKFIAYFQPSFLFFNGLGMTIQGSIGLGVMYLFEIPLLFLGIITLIKKNIPNKALIFCWILLGILPASLTLNEQHPIRTMVILPILVLISAVGAVTFYELVQSISKKFLKLSIVITFSFFVVWNLIYALIIFSVHFPNQKWEGLMEGTKQSVLYVASNRENYKEIVFDPVRGIDGPFLVNAPHVYILFYLNYDPDTYQKMPKREAGGLYGFDKFTIRPINWSQERHKKGVLFIGSPWSLSLKDIKEDEILEKIYLKNGKLALLIVSPK